MTEMHELLLNAWLRLSTSINNARLVSEMTFNESLICNILYNHSKASDGTIITATDLCNMTNMLKSQMNRTLNNMEEKGLIFRKRSEKDKRQVFVSMNMENAKVYEQQHKNVLKFVDAMLEKVGKDKAEEIVQLFTLISNKAKEVMD